MAKMTIYDFNNYRDYLTHCLVRHPLRRKPMSIAQWSKSLKLKSPRTMGMVLSGERRLTPPLAKLLIKDLGLDDSAGTLLELMRERESFAPATDAQIEIDQKIDQLKRVHRPRKAMDKQYESALDQWFILAIQQLLPSLQGTYTATEIAKRFRNLFTEADALRALDFLIKQGIAEPVDEGKLKVKETKAMSSSADVKNLKIQKFHEAMLNFAFTALRTQTSTERNFEGLTLAYDPAQIFEVKKFVRDFIFQFEAKFEAIGSPHVGQLSIQFFPLTDLKESTCPSISPRSLQ